MVKLEIYEGVQIIGQPQKTTTHYVRSELVQAVIEDENSPETDCVVFISNKAVPVKVKGSAKEVAERVG